jgi:uncharacterized protein YndB with AHSA1/START domain
MGDISDRSLSFSRIFDAPRELVWKAWTDPAHVNNWWEPTGFTNTTTEIDVRPGGLWRFVMHGPDGVDYKNLIQFIEVVPPTRLVYAHRGEDETDDIHFHATVTFEDQAGKTQLKMQMVFKTAAELRHVVEEFGAEEGAHQHLARLAVYLETMAGTK